MRIALDTRVLISAHTVRGLSSDVLRHILVEHDFVLPQVVLEEFERELVSNFGVPGNHVTEFMKELALHEVIQSQEGAEDYVMIRDPDDRLVVASAVAGSASILVTGDRDILDVREEIPKLEIMTPREFWTFIRTGPGN